MSLKILKANIHDNCKIIKQAIINPKKYNVLSNLCIKTGLSTEEVEYSILYLINKYKGSLSVAKNGDLLYKFPHGLKDNQSSKIFIKKYFLSIPKYFLNISKTFMRSWISIVMIFYLFFVGFFIIMLMFPKKKTENKGKSLFLHFFLKLLFDSMYWIIHPFTSFIYRPKGLLIAFQNNNDNENISLQKKINQFIFGINENKETISTLTKKILWQIKNNNGYTSMYDLLTITLESKKTIQMLLAKLVIDYNGKIIINKKGGILYYFPEIILSNKYKNTTKKSILPIWNRKTLIPSFTGNSMLSNLVIFGINSCNLFISFFVIDNNLTIEKIQHIINSSAFSNFDSLFVDNFYNDAPLLFGWFPFVFSLAIFMIPLIRLTFRRNIIKKTNNENGYKSLLKSIVFHIKNGQNNIQEDVLIKEWKNFTGKEPDIQVFTKLIIKLGGKIHINQKGKIEYIFPDFSDNYMFLNKKIDKQKLKK